MSKSPWAKRGLAGKTSAAARYARENDLDASDVEILSVGWTAYQDSRDVQDVWQEALHRDLGGGGDE